MLIGSFMVNSSLNKVKADYTKEISILNAKIDYLLQTDGSNDGNDPDTLSYASPLSTAGSLLGQGASSLDLMNQEVVEIVRSAGPSVVGIRVTAPSQQFSFWGWQQIGTKMNEGSGIIYNQEGYILSNFHVMSVAAGQPDAVIEVFLADGRTASGVYVAGDEQNDIAILKIEMSGLTPANFGTSATVVPGEFAMAIGNPLGMTYAGSVTVGIISGVNRIVEAENVADSMLQTNAAINPGNSGGALINGRGQVIGMNTIKLASAELEGLGFAIPIDYVRPIADSLIKYGYVKDRPYTGITGSEISPMTARFYRVPAGLLVGEVQRESASALAGVEAGDIVTQMDGREVNSMSDLNNILKNHKVGDEISLQIYRNGYQYDMTLTLKELK
jgi:serine protease Do